jgi:single-strand DNA-binding protein
MFINKIIFAGNLTKDPETKSGCTYFTVASNMKYTTKEGEKKDEATFARILCFAKLGEAVMSYCAKGTKVLVEGRLKIEQDAEKGQRTCIVASHVHFIAKTKQASEGGNNNEPVGASGINPSDIAWEE